MNKKITAVAMAAMVAGIASADVVMDTLAGLNNQANFSSETGVSFTTSTLTDTGLDTISVRSRISGAAGTGVYLAVYNDIDQNSSTWDKGTLVATSTNSQDMDVNSGTSTWIFSQETLASDTVYLYQFVDGSNNGIGASFGLVNGNSVAGSSMFSGGAEAFGSTHEAATSITTIPEPATIGMVVAFGGSILFIRRKLMM